jgi:hypothetical protein
VQVAHHLAAIAHTQPERVLAGEEALELVVGAAVERAGLGECADMRRVEAALTEPTHAAHLYAAVADAASCGAIHLAPS